MNKMINMITPRGDELLDHLDAFLVLHQKLNAWHTGRSSTTAGHEPEDVPPGPTARSLGLGVGRPGPAKVHHARGSGVSVRALVQGDCQP